MRTVRRPRTLLGVGYLVTLQDLGAIGELVGSVGAVLALVYVAVQVRQNTRGIRSSAHQHVVAANAAVTMAPVHNLEFASLLWRGAKSSKDLTEESQLAFNLWCFQYFAMIQATYQLFLDQTVDRGVWERELQRAVGGLRVPGFREWWEAGGRTQLSPDFVSLVESTPLDIVAVSWSPEHGFLQSTWTEGDV